MIMDSISHADLYVSLHKELKSAFDFLKSLEMGQIDGKYELDGERLYVTIATLQPSPLEGRDLEAHRNYIDLHYILEGEELVEYADIQYLERKTNYDKEKDVCFLSGAGSILHCRPGDFYIVYPQDAHKPCGAVGSKPLRKAIVKILYQ